MALIPLTVLLRKTNAGYCFRNKTKVNHLSYTDDLKLFGKSKNDITPLIHTVRISSEDIRIEFGPDKCATVALARGRMAEGAENITLPGDKEISASGTKSQYRYQIGRAHV